MIQTVSKIKSFLIISGVSLLVSASASAGTLLTYVVDAQPVDVLISENFVSTKEAQLSFETREILMLDHQSKKFTKTSTDEMIEEAKKITAMMDQLKNFMPPEQLEAMGMGNKAQDKFETKPVGEKTINGIACKAYEFVSQKGTSSVCFAAFEALGISSKVQNQLESMAKMFEESASQLPFNMGANPGFETIALGLPIYGKSYDGETLELKSHQKTSQKTLANIPEGYQEENMPSIDDLGESMMQGMESLKNLPQMNMQQ